jgi:hypothetical protein
MKALYSLFILSALTLGSNAYSQEISTLKFSDIKSIKLHSGKIINMKKDVESIQLAFDRDNKVDYIELLEGSVIDSYDIEKVILQKPSSRILSDDSLNSSHFNSAFMLKRVMGDGSGG